MMNFDEDLRDLFLAHGITLTPHKGWLMTNEIYPACRSFVHQPQANQNSFSVRVDIEVALDSRRVIVESFADAATTADEALDNVYRNFVTSSFHVFLSAVWGHQDDEQLTKETWDINGNAWHIFLSGAVLKSFGGGEPYFPDDIMQTIKAMIYSEKLTNEMHWVRIYFANIPNDEQFTEVLFDNEPWETGARCLNNIVWPEWNTFYSFRMFIMLQPADAEAI